MYVGTTSRLKSRRWVVRGTVALALTVLVAFAMIGLVTCLAGDNSELEEPSASQLRKDLHVTAKRFLAVLEGRNERDLVDMISRKGIVIGPDPPPIEFEEIRRQISNRVNAYCVLFDTACLRKDWRQHYGKHGPPENLYSFREMLQKSPERKLTITVSRTDDPWFGDAWFGQVVVRRERKPEQDRFWLGDLLDFGFVHEDGTWRLMAVTYP